MRAKTLQDSRSLRSNLGSGWTPTSEEELQKEKDFYEDKVKPVMKELDIKRIKSYEKLASVSLG